MPRRTLVFDDADTVAWLCGSCRSRLQEWEGLMDSHELCRACYEPWSGRGGSAT